MNREHFIKQNILTTSIFINAAGFLRIVQDSDFKDPKSRAGPNADYSDSPDPLDNTRVHPEDYDLARKMALDALELDEEDVADEHPSNVVAQLMKDPENERKIDELNLDEFAISMKTTRNESKRSILSLIRKELLKPFGELRDAFTLPDAEDVFYMLTSLRESDLRMGYKVTASVYRNTEAHVVVHLPFSGLEGIIKKNFLHDDDEEPRTLRKGQVLDAVVLEIRKDLDKDIFCADLSVRPSHLEQDDLELRVTKRDDFWDHDAERHDNEVSQRKRNAENNRTRRVIKHPNFHNFNSQKAEAYLEDQHPGDVVIRPSSKGPNHLAVTWKVADKLYQHIGQYMHMYSVFLLTLVSGRCLRTERHHQRSANWRTAYCRREIRVH